MGDLDGVRRELDNLRNYCISMNFPAAYKVAAVSLLDHKHATIYYAKEEIEDIRDAHIKRVKLNVIDRLSKVTIKDKVANIVMKLEHELERERIAKERLKQLII